jgi:glycosyltransferase involved in cell wall biosynthesis
MGVKNDGSDIGKIGASIAFCGFRGGPGGISHVMVNLINGFSEMGIRVDLLLYDTDIPERKRLHPRVRTILLGDVRGPGRIPPLMAYFRKEAPEVLMAVRESAVRAAVLARQLGGVGPRIVVRVGMAVSMALDRRGPVKRWFRRSFIRYCYRRADAVIGNDPGVAADIARVTGLPLSAIHVLSNPTVSDALSAEAQQAADHPWLTGGGEPLVLGVGRLVRQKDFPTLIKAVALLRRRVDCRLLILGEGKERGRLESLVADLGIGEWVDLPGFVPNPFAFMARASVFALSSAWEGSPNVLIQALALGTPAVATNCRSGPEDILDGGRLGRLVPVGDAAALARAIEETVATPPDPTLLKRGVERFRKDICCRRYAEVLNLVEGADGH